ncbi:MAG: DUF3830 family protein [Kordiimonadaceae bacterium]|jgi:hypothetical protein|nr:DUF3830 family protein [Kordiimonadaceae bacterium]MBT6031678.1 DUF3830 family protein [Kordiimonadaceae bacterium]
MTLSESAKRQICFKEAGSNMSVICDLLDDQAPKSAEFLWQLAQNRSSFDAIHAIWTGPELSCPLPASVLPEELSINVIPAENATSYPDCGDIVLASIAAGTIEGLPPGNFFDVGLFYGEGGRMLMPFGWIEVNVCAKIIAKDLAHAQEAMAMIRQRGACQLSFAPVE